LGIWGRIWGLSQEFSEFGDCPQIPNFSLIHRTGHCVGCTQRVNESAILLTNIDSVPGKTIVEHFGLVQGTTIRAKHIGTDTLASLKNIIGGELKGYTKLLQESRQEATSRMIEQALQLGANAIINVRFATSSVAKGAAELFAYGTAVRVE